MRGGGLLFGRSVNSRLALCTVLALGPKVAHAGEAVTAAPAVGPTAGVASDAHPVETRDPSAESSPQPVDLRWGGIGGEIAFAALFSGWRGGGDLVASAGVAVPVRSWVYDGSHRVTFPQVDANVGYALLSGSGIWVLGAGPAYHATSKLWQPLLKAQFYVAGPLPIRGRALSFQSAGFAVTWSWELTTVRKKEINHPNEYQFAD